MGGSPPRCPGWSCRDSCCYGNAGRVSGTGGGWELGAPRRSPHLRESVMGRREAVPLSAFSRSAAMGRCWITLQRAAPAARVPGPSFAPRPPPPRACQPGSRRPGLATLVGPGALMFWRGAVGTWSHAGGGLTVRSRADPGRSCRVREGSRCLRLKRQTHWEGGGRLGPPPCPPLL